MHLKGDKPRQQQATEGKEQGSKGVKQGAAVEITGLGDKRKGLTETGQLAEEESRYAQSKN
jgi:hypothetical protein